jgi:hypothetical protein
MVHEKGSNCHKHDYFLCKKNSLKGFQIEIARVFQDIDFKRYPMQDNVFYMR